MVARKSECHSTSKDLVTRNQKRREATSLTEKKVPSLREVVIEVAAVEAAAEAVAEADLTETDTNKRLLLYFNCIKICY